MEYYQPFIEKLPHDLDFGILNYENESFYVNEIEVTNNRAIHSDVVFVKDSKVVGIKDRNQNFIVGILYLNNNIKYGFTKKNVPYFKFKPISEKYPEFIVPSKLKNKEKYYCVIKFNKWDIKNKHPIGQIENLIGTLGNIKNEIDMLLYRTNIYPRVKKIDYNKMPIITDEINYYTFSIDPDGCQDIDDAFHFNNKINGYEIGIHIANVARFINYIDVNFYSSIYLDQNQINMLSNDHSFNLCSLGNKEKKRSMSLILNYNLDKELVSYKFEESIVYNIAYSYKRCDEIIKSNFDELDNFNKKIKKLFNLYNQITLEKNTSSTNMVEYFMLIYNSITASVLYKYNPNTILRTHKNNHDLQTQESILQKYLNKTSQNAALYEINPTLTRHDALDLNFYTHATSPIRRYVDILNQQNLIKYLSSEELIIEPKIDDVNLFSKKLRKFNNLYNKLNLIFKLESFKNYDAYIISIKHNRIKIYIPQLEIEHKFTIISNKLLDSNEVISSLDSIKINDIEFKLYQKIKVKLTSLKHEDIFDKKLHVEVVKPRILLI
jgi:exoribonuclease R